MANADIVEDLKKVLASGKFVLGSDEILKLVRKGGVKKVFLSSNCSPVVKADVQRLCGIGKIECFELEQTAEEIGVLCKKPFSVSMVGVTA